MVDAAGRGCADRHPGDERAPGRHYGQGAGGPDPRNPGRSVDGGGRQHPPGCQSGEHRQRICRRRGKHGDL